MTSAAGLLTVYCLLVLVASLLGGWLPILVHLTHTRLQMAISFVAGLMLGIALLHFLPDAAEQLHSLNRTVSWVLGGFLAMFFLQRFFHFHHHDLPEGDPEDCCGHDHDHDAPADHDHDHSKTLAEKSARHLSWVGTALGLSLHSLLDGLALAAAVEASVKGHAGLAGLGVALAVILHKPFDAMAVTTLMSAGGSSRFSRQLLNALFALATPLGAAVFYLGANHFADSNAVFLGCALAFCAGTFLCIACSDLLPELQFHSHDRFKLSIALVAGLVVALLIGQIEAHDHAPDENKLAAQVSPRFLLPRFSLTEIVSRTWNHDGHVITLLRQVDLPASDSNLPECKAMIFGISDSGRTVCIEFYAYDSFCLENQNHTLLLRDWHCPVVDTSVTVEKQGKREIFRVAGVDDGSPVVHRSYSYELMPQFQLVGGMSEFISKE